MGTKRVTRHVVCAFCGAATSMPSQRGPAPMYCSPAHRQAAYRQRKREEGHTTSSPAPAPSLRDELEALRGALREASEAANWTAARRMLARSLEDSPKQGGRKKP